MLIFLSLALLYYSDAFNFQANHCRPQLPRLPMSRQEEGRNNKEIIIEIVSRRRNSDRETKIVAFDSVYEDVVEEKTVIEKAVDSPLSKVLEVCFNPTTLLLAVYLSSIGWSKVTWLQQILKIFGKGTLVKKNDGSAEVEVEELPFQIFECEKCKMEMRPARGRAEKIFARKRFRCPRCGSKAGAFFDVDNMEDPRAVERLERLKQEKEDEDNEIYGDDDEDEDDE